MQDAGSRLQVIAEHPWGVAAAVTPSLAGTPPGQPLVGWPLTATLTGGEDPRWQWYRSGDGHLRSIDGASFDSYTPVDRDAGRQLLVLATYTWPGGEGEGLAGAVTGTLPGEPVEDNGLSETSARYDTDGDGAYTFAGVIKNQRRQEHAVGGPGTVAVVPGATPTPDPAGNGTPAPASTPAPTAAATPAPTAIAPANAAAARETPAPEEAAVPTVVAAVSGTPAPEAAPTAAPAPTPTRRPMATTAPTAAPEPMPLAGPLTGGSGAKGEAPPSPARSVTGEDFPAWAVAAIVGGFAALFVAGLAAIFILARRRREERRQWSRW